MVMRKVSSVLWGIIFVAVGVILALNAFGISGINIFFDGWWTLFIIVPCVNGLITDDDKSGSIIGICIGVFLLLCCQDILSFDMFWKLLVPAIVVLIGIRMILGGVLGDRNAEFNWKAGNPGGKSGAAVFSGTSFDYAGEVFDGAQLDAIFGGVKCDLRGAVINGDCVINACAVFGGIDIYVPETLNVKVRSNSIFGGVSGKNHRCNVPGQPTLYLNATCMFGGVDIK